MLSVHAQGRVRHKGVPSRERKGAGPLPGNPGLAPGVMKSVTLPVFLNRVGDIRSALRSASKATGIRVLRHSELADHVHLLVSFTPRHRLSDFLRQVKSVAAFRAGQRVAGAVKWARGYYIATYHRKDLARIANYIALQYERHPDRIPKQINRRT